MSKWQWYEFVEKKAYRGRLWKMIGKNSTYEKCGEEAEKERQAGIQGQWQQESTAREYLEQVKCCNDTDCTQRMMRSWLFCIEKWRVGRQQKHFQK